MTILLDTCAAMWLSAGAAVSEDARRALREARDRNEAVYVSPITAWEIGLLARSGKFASPHPPRVWFERLLAIEGIRLESLTPSVLIESSFLPGDPPRNPSDRVIIAAARERNHTVMTRDRLILEYAKAGHVRTLTC